MVLRIVSISFLFIVHVFSQNVQILTRNRQNWMNYKQNIISPDDFSPNKKIFFSWMENIDALRVSNAIVSLECQQDLRLIAEILVGVVANNNAGSEARSAVFQQIDASAKIPAGIFRGNLVWTGAYRECVGISATIANRSRKYDTDYCRAVFALNPAAFGKSDKSIPHSVKSCDITTGGVQLSQDICLPKSCSSRADSTALLQSFTGRVNSSLCDVRCANNDDVKLGTGGVVVSSILCFALALSIVASIIDYCWYQQFKNSSKLSKNKSMQILLAFSLYTNIGEILSTKSRPGQIGPLNCIRFFSIVWVVVGHVLLWVLPLSDNALDVLPIIRDVPTQILTNAYFSVDSFFFLSGLLLGFLWFKELDRDRQQTLSARTWIMFYVHRILRLSPAYYMTIAFYTCVASYLFARDLPLLGTAHYLTDACNKNWWTNVLYINNLIGYDEPCLGPSWYLATDMQIYIFTPLILLPLALRPIFGISLSFILIAASTAANIFTIYHFHFGPVGSQPGAAVDPQRSANASYDFYLYDAPWIRFPIYLMGILLGYYLRTNRRTIVINSFLNIIAWCLSLATMLTLVLGLYDWANGVQLSLFWRAMYSAFSRIAWGLALSWIIFSCFYGYGGPIDKFMSWHIWTPLGRLTYCIYLLHHPIIGIIIGMRDGTVHFSSITEMFVTLVTPIMAITLFAALIWSSTFEVAVGKIETLLLRGGYRNSTTTHKNLQENGKIHNVDVKF